MAGDFPYQERTALVQFSTGLASAECALRAVREYGRVELLTANTLVEDDDNWRFAMDVWRFIGQPPWHVVADGRTPMQVGRDHRCVPNNRMAVCSRVLKRELLRDFIDTHYDPAECDVIVGFDWTEPDRIDASTPLWLPWTLRCPLNEPPYTAKADLLRTWRDEYGIDPPSLYSTGAPHANCGGACVRGGQVEWRRLLFSNRDRYLEWEGEEEMTRGMLGKDVSILRDRRTKRDKEGQALSLQEFRERIEINPSMFDVNDSGACACL